MTVLMRIQGGCPTRRVPASSRLAFNSSLAFLTKLNRNIRDFDIALHFGRSLHIIDHRLQCLVVTESFPQHELALDVVDRAHQIATFMRKLSIMYLIADSLLVRNSSTLSTRRGQSERFFPDSA